MLTLTRIVTIVSFMILLAACNSSSRWTPDIWDGENRFQNQVQLITDVQTIQFVDNGFDLSEQQIAILQHKFKQPESIKNVYLTHCEFNDPLSEQRLAAVFEQLQALGLQPQIVNFPLEVNEDNTNCVKAIAHRLQVVIPNCPDVSNIHSRYGNISSNFGCANVHNLGKMVVNPSDFLAEEGYDATLAERAVYGVQLYDRGETTEFAAPTELTTE